MNEYRFEFVGGSRNGLRSVGFEAYGHYLATDNGEIGGRIKMLTLDCLKQIQVEGLSADLVYETYQVVEHRREGDAIVAFCRTVADDPATER